MVLLLGISAGLPDPKQCNHFISGKLHQNCIFCFCTKFCHTVVELHTFNIYNHLNQGKQNVVNIKHFSITLKVINKPKTQDIEQIPFSFFVWTAFLLQEIC